ncbi:3D domain-containing protein [Clostridium sp. A1-XYC3]|uniref:3D domain-containing protein n=1 Tax=Clostridium tanneri TaxID=3037988 RepID=A0ABU4JWU1_9CLOT|nr:3D domain-containing protein [Clostridium sp. A1-XYC3]MDW8802624.1 3D domain-containing protein [Clostridium sp. A1-XYC3]
MSIKSKEFIITLIFFIGLLSFQYSYGYVKSQRLYSKNSAHADNNLNTSSTTNKDTEKKSNSSVNKNISEEKQVKNHTKEDRQATLSISPNNKQPSRGGNISNTIDINLTFYTSLPEENGGHEGINCSGKKLTPGTVANNVLPLGTRIYTEEFGTLTVEDRGGDNFNTIHRLDVYVPRKAGESIADYKTRVINMGIVKVKGYIAN